MSTDSTYDAQKEDEKNASNEIIDLGGVLRRALRATPVMLFIRQPFILRIVRTSGQAMYLVEHMVGKKPGQAGIGTMPY